MSAKEQFFTLINDNMGAMRPFYQEAMGTAIQEYGVPERWFGLSLARGSDPAPITPKRLHEMYPYSAMETFVDNLEELSQFEQLERVAGNAYRITDLGRESVDGIYLAVHQALGSINPLPPADMDKLNNILYRLVEAIFEAPKPEEKWAITYSRWSDPGQNAPGAARADQYLTDLYQFRDDAHIAAWNPYGVSGQAWEALTFIWRDEAHTAEDLVETLSVRGHTAEDYNKALDELSARGWVERTGEGYQITTKGKELRQEAEETTDRIYFAPWDCLSEDEETQLKKLLTQLKDSLESMAENSDE